MKGGVGFIPALKREAFSSILRKHAIAAAADDGREAIELHVERSNRTARSVYRRLGFSAVDEGAGVRMELPLDETIATTVREPPAHRPQSAN